MNHLDENDGLDAPNQKREAATAYQRFALEREDYLIRGREVASLTIPFLLPPDGTNSTSRLPTPYQGTGAEGVNNLASKLVLTLFPPSAPFFRLVAHPAAIRALAAEQGVDEETIVQTVNEDISVMEQEIQLEVETRALRPALYEVFRHLIVAGNALIRWDGPKMRVFSLANYVVKRDGSGTILWIVTEETMDRDALPEGVTAPKEKKVVKLYTAAKRTSDGKYRVWQEIEEAVFQADTIEEDALPYVVPRMFELVGESYGRGLGEHYLGDLISLEALSRAIVQSSAAAAHIVWMVNPNGFTRVQDLEKARTGAYVPGLTTDVQPLHLDKGADLQITAQTAQRIETKLNRVFLLNLGAQRDAERVTAEEVKLVAEQVEAAHGGSMSLFSEQLQLPIARTIIADMRAEEKLLKFEDGVISPKVITGLEGLGRTAELERFRTFLAVAGESLGQEVVVERLEPSGVLTRIAAATGVDTSGILKTEDKLAKERQAQQQAQALQSAIGPAAGGAAGPLAQAVVDNAGVEAGETQQAGQ